MAKAKVVDSIMGPPMALRRSARNASKKEIDVPIKEEDLPAKPLAAPAQKRKRAKIEDEETSKIQPSTKSIKIKKSSSSSPSAPSPSHTLAQVKLETSSPKKEVKGNKKDGRESSKEDNSSSSSKTTKEADLRAKKLKSYTQFANKSPFPEFPRPTPEECHRAYDVLAALHGERQRPEKVSAPADRAGCGDSPSVLDALVRTILSQNTSNKNSTRAKLDMDEVYGGSGDTDTDERWEAILSGGQAKLESAIARGGLGGVKSRVIIDILRQVKERHGRYSLDHLLTLEASGEDDGDDEAAMRELISFKGVGPKTASCVLLFCVGRDSFAVDTHVHRLTGTLGWRPQSASRDEAFAHLDARIPDALKYGLHVLFVEHGRKCPECKAGGKALGRCALRKAFRVQNESGNRVGDGDEDEE
ncbi:hypothetical protein M426DRAFT_320666 [Hypoxylon sp. CI-4A]|nr:hypothetical protein M426DRAFT_320666 [Hypoxylon sp. CI-4A]